MAQNDQLRKHPVKISGAVCTPATKDQINEEEYKLFKIKEGVVIDHIPARKALDVINILGVEHDPNSIVSVGINFMSKKLGHKDVIKVENKHLTREELNKITLIAPFATVNIISNFEVAEKVQIVIPHVFENIAKCPNPNCVTSYEYAESKFITVDEQNFKVKCAYCERIFDMDSVKLL